MILYLFGGSSPESEEAHYSLIFRQLGILSPKQILFLGFAGQDSQSRQAFQNNLRSKFPEAFLDASSTSDLKMADRPLIFVGGGHNHQALYDFVIQNPILHDLVLNARYYFGDSAGAMLVGSKQRRISGNQSPPMAGLCILKETVIEPHYTQGAKSGVLRREMKDWDCSVGIGLDEACGIKLDTDKFPGDYEVLGGGLVEVLVGAHADSNELLDLVDDHDQVVGQVGRSQAHRDPSLIHREVLVLVHDGKNKILLQQRSRRKELYPLWWVESCAGHVPQGMSPGTAAHKELKEELGFDCELEFLGKTRNQTPQETRFMYWYLGNYAGQPINVDSNEVEEVKFFTEDEFNQLLKSGQPVGEHSRWIVEKYWSGGLPI